MKKFMHNFSEAFLKEFRLVIKDPGLLVFFILLPLAYPIVYSLIYNPEVVREVPVVVVDSDRSPLSRELVRRLDACQGTRIKGYAANLQEAKRAMHEHDAYGILQIPEGFEKKIGNNEQGNVVLFCEMSLMLRYKALLVSATDIMLDLGGSITTEKIDLIAPEAATISSGDLMPVENVALGNIESGFDSFVMPGILILILQQVVMLAIGMAGGAMREYPLNADFNPATGKPGCLATMPARILAYLVIMAIPTIYIIVIVPIIFRFPMSGNFLAELLFLLPMLLSSIALGFILQGIVRERESVFVIWVVTSVVFLFLSGLTWPRYAFPPVWTFISDLVPATWGVEGFVKMNTNGSSIAQVSDCYINLWIQSAVYIFFAYLSQKFIQRPAIMRAYEEQLQSAAIADNASSKADNTRC